MATNIDTGRAIRTALMQKAENGNTSYIKWEDVKACQGNRQVWNEWNDTLIKMEQLAREFVFYYYSVLKGSSAAKLDEEKVKRDEKLTALNDAIIKEKKELLKWVDPEQKHRCAFCDGIVIGEYAHSVIRRKNNVSGERGFKSRASHTYAERRTFRKRLEFYLAQVIEGADIIDPEHAHYLRVEKKLLGKINSAKSAQEQLRQKREGMVSNAAMFGTPEEILAKALEPIDEDIKAKDEAISEAESVLAEFRKSHRDRVLTEPEFDADGDINESEDEKQVVTSVTSAEVNGMTMKELKEVLDENGVQYPKKATKSELVEKVMQVMLSEKSESEPEQAEPETAVEKVTEPEQATAEAK